MSSTVLYPVVHVGEAPPEFFSAWFSTTAVCFHGFADLPHEHGSSVKSSSFRCLGTEWCLQLYPRGDSRDDEEHVSLFLVHLGAESINIEYSLNVRGITSMVSVTRHFEVEGSGYGYNNFLKRETALKSLVKGTLVIEVRMKAHRRGSTFVPSNPSTGLTLGDLFIKESADVMFEIGVGAVATGTFYAHRCILMKAAPQLANLCTASPGDKSPFLVPLHNMPVHAFEALLRYIYGFNIYDVGKDIVRIKEILETADRFDVVNLKLEAEELLISSISLDVDNAIDHYVYAEDQNCAALKEKVVAFIVDHWDDIHASKRENDLPDNLRLSLMHDMMVATKIKDDPGDDGALHTMPISTLRRKVHQKRLNVDGSRETLIALLK